MMRSPRVALIATVVVAATWPRSWAEEPGERRFALVVGVRDYKGTELSNLKYTENDAHDLADVLRQVGYRRVVLLTQKAAYKAEQKDLFPTAANIRLHLKSLLEDKLASDTVFVAFSGHGVQLKKFNKLYFCPEGANLNDPATLVALDDVYEELKACRAGVRVLAADACRNDPLDGKPAGDERLESVTRPLLPDPPKGVAALFSCSKGQKSFESEAHKHGFFMHYLMEGLKGKAANKRGEVDLPALVQFVQDEVPEAVKDQDASYRQLPEPFLGIQGKVTVARVTPAKVAVPPRETGNVVKDKKGASNGLEMRFVRVPKGTFWMGGENGKPGDKQVQIKEDFFLGATAVTQVQWRAIMDDNPSFLSRKGKGAENVKGISDEDLDQFPVENVSWNEVQEFLAKLNKKEAGREWKYRLPREAEWEYACRGAANSKAECSFNYYFAKPTNNLSSDDANFNPGADAVKAKKFVGPCKVGSYQPNRLGLYDMHGNVEQWCEDLYQAGDAARVVRGGSWADLDYACTAAHRTGNQPDFRMPFLGFRLVRVPSSGRGK